MAALQATLRLGQTTDLSTVLGPPGSAQLPADDITSTPDLHLWVVEADQSVIGVIGMERYGAGALLRSVAIAPDYQRQGLGRGLVASLERIAHGWGFERPVLLTETDEGFLKDMGYAVVDRRNVADEIKQSAEFCTLCPLTAVYMLKFVVNQPQD